MGGCATAVELFGIFVLPPGGERGDVEFQNPFSQKRKENFLFTYRGTGFTIISESAALAKQCFT